MGDFTVSDQTMRTSLSSWPFALAIRALEVAKSQCPLCLVLSLRFCSLSRRGSNDIGSR